MRSVHRFWNVYYSSVEFLKAHRIKLIVLLAVFVVACAIGVKAGCASDAKAVLSGRINFYLLVGADDRSVVGYIFFNVACHTLCFGALVLTGVNFYLSFFGVLVFFYSSYTMGYGAAVYLAYFKFAALPYIIVCYVPFCLVTISTMGCVVSLAVECGCEVRKNGYFHIGIIKDRLPVFLSLTAVMLVSVLYLGIFGGIFTVGLII